MPPLRLFYVAMKILLTNDDGICAPGMWALYHRLASHHEVHVIAPSRERSAVGHGITLHRPLRAEPVTMADGCRGFAVSGTPVDCVKLGVLEILAEPPDLVISGINAGANVGVNINYSGTVSAAKEAALYGFPAIAASIAGRSMQHCSDGAAFVAWLAETVHLRALPTGTFLNVNLPDQPLGTMGGVRVRRQATRFFPEFVEKRVDPRQRHYYWHGTDGFGGSQEADSDEDALARNFIVVTPIKCDHTDYAAMEDVSTWGLETALASTESKKLTF